MTDLLISGFGAFTPLGDDERTIADHLRCGRSGVQPSTIPGHDCVFGHAPIGFAWADEWRRLRAVDERFARLVSDHGLLALRTIERLMDATGLRLGEVDASRVAVLATALTDTPEHAWASFRADPRAFNKFHGGHYTFSATTSILGRFLGLRGPCFNVNMACASSGAALMTAAMLLQTGRADAAIVVATNLRHETPLMHQALMNLGVFSRRGILAYGAAGRDGSVAGDTSVAVLIETAEHLARRGGSSPLAVLRSIDVNDDGGSYLAPSSGGVGALLAHTKKAIGAVDYINPHGAGTRGGDAVELGAIRDVFGGRVLVNSTKAYAGHAFDACFVQELMHTVVQMAGGFVAPVLHTREVAADCHGVELVLGDAVVTPVRRAVCFNLGMGGVNAAAAVSLP